MPRKKKVSEEVSEEISDDAVKESFDKGAQLKAQTCGHVNKQFVNKDGVRENLVCTLKKGHDGDHFAVFERVVTEYGVDKDNRPSVTGSHVQEEEGWWSDAAGEFPNPHIKTSEEDFEALKKARARERGTDEAISDKIDKEVRETYG